jgi:glycosyltransferase involved in cell wall biosynthesis
LGVALGGDGASPPRPGRLGPRTRAMTRPRVCLDLTPSEMRDRFGGFTRYGLALLDAILALPESAEFDWLVLPRSDRPPIPAADFGTRREIDGPIIGTRRHRWQRIWWAGRLLREANVDLFHSLGPAARPLRTGGRLVATAHDLASIVCPPPATAVVARLERLDDFVRQHVRHRGWDHLIAISATTKRDLIERLRVPSDAITVIQHGVDARMFAPSDTGHPVPRPEPVRQTPMPYLLSVGSDHERKNQLTLFEAWRMACERMAEGLVFVGRPLYSDTFARIRSEAERSGLAHRVTCLSDVTDAELAGLYRRATAVVAPSLYEGFGLTLLEAAACGTPVVASRVAAHLEVAGDAAAYFDPQSTAELADLIVALANDRARRDRLRARGLARAARFTWQRAARETVAVYRRVLDGGTR